MPVEFSIYSKGSNRDLLKPHSEDINRLHLKFEHEVLPHMEEIGGTHQKFFETLDDYDFVIFATEDEGRVIGFATLSRRPGMDEWELVTSYVDSPYRGRGIWRKMVDMRIQIARDRGASSILILPQQFLRTPLVNMGFEESFTEEDMKKILRE